MADAAFSATPLGNLINKSLYAQEKQDKTITLRISQKTGTWRGG